MAFLSLSEMCSVGRCFLTMLLSFVLRCRRQEGIMHYSQLLTLQHSTKLQVDLSLSSKFRPPHEGWIPGLSTLKVTGFSATLKY